MMALVLSFTNAGLAAVQGASGSDPVTIAELGLTATPFTVAPTLTALPGEFKRIAAVAGTSVAANITHMSAYDTSADVWNATGLGLWLSDGTLFAVYSSPTTIVNKAGPAFALIAFDIAWLADDAASITFGDPIFTNPPATTTARGLVELATGEETFEAADNQRAVTPQSLGLALLDMIKARDGIGSGIDADRFQGQDIGYFLAASAYTAASVLALLITVDGAGSGLDADTLDGQHLSQIAPAGIVALWPVSRGAIPAGWAIMDGENGTDDWRDKFVMSAGPTYAAGTSGGAALHNHAITVEGHALTEAELPAHNHTMFANLASDSPLSGATSVAARTTSSPGESEYNLTSGGATAPTLGLTGETGAGDPHAHTASAGNASSLPPYVVAYYIQKL